MSEATRPGHRPRPDPYPDELDELFCDEDETLCTDDRPCMCCWVDQQEEAIPPPGCDLPGCKHHYAPGRNLAAEGCICPAWFDGGGWHLIQRKSACTAHRVATP